MHSLIQQRRSIRRYTQRVPSDDQVKQILLAAMVAPSANGLHPVEFIVVKNQETINKLSLCGPHQSFLKDTPVVIVVVADPIKSEKMWSIDAGIAASHIYLEAVNQGLATCWANVYLGRRDDGSDREEYVRNLLGIPANKRPICVMPLGYPDETKNPYSEQDYDQSKVHHENW